ncbi:hypothetical protein IF2G_03289 [Cordyceps javanica]|nr:hypothetical protein IF2G_03289 [Cordyceps javanica]
MSIPTKLPTVEWPFFSASTKCASIPDVNTIYACYCFTVACSCISSNWHRQRHHGRIATRLLQHAHSTGRDNVCVLRYVASPAISISKRRASACTYLPHACRSHGDQSASFDQFAVADRSNRQGTTFDFGFALCRIVSYTLCNSKHWPFNAVALNATGLDLSHAALRY